MHAKTSVLNSFVSWAQVCLCLLGKAGLMVSPCLSKALNIIYFSDDHTIKVQILGDSAY